jgi:hypothetical protein
MERVRRDVKETLSCHRRWAEWRAPWEVTPARLSHMTARFQQTTRPGIELVQTFCSSA